MERVVERRLCAATRRLLLLDLCAGMQSAHMQDCHVHTDTCAYRRRAAWLEPRDTGCEIAYVSVDVSADCQPDLQIDLLDANMHDVLRRACELVGWELASTAVLVCLCCM